MFSKPKTPVLVSALKVLAYLFTCVGLFFVAFNTQDLIKSNETVLQYRPSRISPIHFNYSSDFSESLNKTGEEFWKSIKPSFECPQNLLKKLGFKGAGKWTCGISNLGKIPGGYQTPCVVYSFGVNKDSSFEAEVLANTHCEVFAYDPTVDKIGHPLRPSNPRVHFKKLGISGKDFGMFKTLKTFMEENGGHKWIDILKIDVEGAEYESLSKILDDFPKELPFGQLLLEVHIFNWNGQSIDGPPTAPSKAKLVVNFLKMLERKNFRIFNLEVNSNDRNCCSEFSFINVNEFSLKRFL